MNLVLTTLTILMGVLTAMCFCIFMFVMDFKAESLNFKLCKMVILGCIGILYIVSLATTIAWTIELLTN